jgi:hypothetical protein
MREETATKVMVIAGFTVLAITIALIISLLSRPVPATAVAGGPLGLDEYSITSQSAARTAAAQNAKYERDLAARKAQAARAARAAERKKLEDARKAQKKKQASVVRKQLHGPLLWQQRGPYGIDSLSASQVVVGTTMVPVAMTVVCNSYRPHGDLTSQVVIPHMLGRLHANSRLLSLKRC